MIDSHVHIIPGVDDGSKNSEMSAAMLELAKSDGVKQWIFTPHYNHACCQLSYEALFARYNAWLEEGGHGLTRDNTRFGVEVYIDEAFMEALPNMSKLPTFENSAYMLVEFSRGIKLDRMLEVVYELRLKGIVPIIAHIEMYADVVKKPEAVLDLCREGALVQVSASSIVSGKYKRFIDALISQNTIDFVASDGHNLTSRPPKLREAYDLIAKAYGKPFAERLFIDAPTILFDGKPYARPVRIEYKKSRVKVAISIMALVALIVAGLSFSRPQSDVGHAVDTTEGTQVSTTVATSTTAVASTTAETTAEVGTTAEGSTESTTEKIAEQTTTSITVELPSYDAVVDVYVSRLSVLESQYKADVQRIFEAVQNTRQFTYDQEKRKALLEGYVAEVGVLEEKCDLEVYDILYDFQNELEKYKYPVTIIESSREAYHQIKEETKQQYLDEL